MPLLHLQDPLNNPGDPYLEGDACHVNEMGLHIFPEEGDRMEGGKNCNDFTEEEDDIEGPASTSQVRLNHKEETSRLEDSRSAPQLPAHKQFRRIRKRVMSWLSYSALLPYEEMSD